MINPVKKIRFIDFLRRRILLVLGLFLILTLVFLGLVLYKFIYLVIIQEPEISAPKVEFKKELLDALQASVKDREETLKRIEKGAYRDIFNP